MQREPEIVTASMAGIWRTATIEGATVTEGQVIGYIEAIKLDAAITAPCTGAIHYVRSTDFCDVSGGDVVAEITPCAS